MQYSVKNEQQSATSPILFLIEVMIYNDRENFEC